MARARHRRAPVQSHRTTLHSCVRGTGLQSSTFRLIISAFCGIGGAFRGNVGGVHVAAGGMRGVKGVFCVRNSSG